MKSGHVLPYNIEGIVATSGLDRSGSMWYAPSMSDSAESLIGKPLVVYIDGERKEIGTITNAKTEGEGLYVAAKLDRPLEPQVEGAIFKELHEDA